MSHHTSHSLGGAPFSWEDKAVVSKDVTPEAEESPKAPTVPLQEPINLPPPPCRQFSGSKLAAGHGVHLPPPPCAFQSPRRRSPLSKSKGSRREEEDPFFAAYMECTKSVRKQAKDPKQRKREGWVGLEKVVLGLSCKHSVAVREDGMVRLAQPIPSREKERVGRGEGRSMGIRKGKGQ